MLTIINGKIVGPDSKEIRLRGINLGGWLMMEGYILGGRNIPEHIFKKELAKLYGKKFPAEFSKRFRKNFITEKDIANIKNRGFNCVRLPFNCRLMAEKGGLGFLKKIIRSFARNKIYVILDMHAVPGAQNTDWHSDSSGKAEIFDSKKHQKEFIAIWKKLALVFKKEKWIAGYDIMNEPVTEKTGVLRNIYQQAVNAIRSAGDRHIIFLEGNNWARELDFIQEVSGENLALSVHFYEPIQFTFNWLPDTSYPGTVLGKKWDKKTLGKMLKEYSRFGEKLKMPILAGEFGVASRCLHCAKEFDWVKDVLDMFEEFGFHWTYWTYKSVKGMNFPDGLYQLTDNSGIIGCAGAVSGMENFYKILKTRKQAFYHIWDTANFSIHQQLCAILKKFL